MLEVPEDSVVVPSLAGLGDSRRLRFNAAGDVVHSMLARRHAKSDGEVRNGHLLRPQVVEDISDGVTQPAATQFREDLAANRIDSNVWIAHRPVPRQPLLLARHDRTSDLLIAASKKLCEARCAVRGSTNDLSRTKPMR